MLSSPPGTSTLRTRACWWGQVQLHISVRPRSKSLPICHRASASRFIYFFGERHRKKGPPEWRQRLQKRLSYEAAKPVSLCSAPPRQGSPCSAKTPRHRGDFPTALYSDILTQHVATLLPSVGIPTKRTAGAVQSSSQAASRRQVRPDSGSKVRCIIESQQCTGSGRSQAGSTGDIEAVARGRRAQARQARTQGRPRSSTQARGTRTSRSQKPGQGREACRESKDSVYHRSRCRYFHRTKITNTKGQAHAARRRSLSTQVTGTSGRIAGMETAGEVW